MLEDDVPLGVVPRTTDDKNKKVMVAQAKDGIDVPVPMGTLKQLPRRRGGYEAASLDQERIVFAKTSVIDGRVRTRNGRYNSQFAWAKRENSGWRIWQMKETTDLSAKESLGRYGKK